MSRPLRYEDLGASADKADVHKAIASEHPGIFPGAFCKVLPDSLAGSPEHCLLLHADGAGTKSILAYLHWKETGDASVFRGIAQDALVMNLDDLAAAGAFGPFLLSNTIGRNAKRVPGEIISEIVAGYRDCAALLAAHGILVESGGGETADLGDSVRTLVVDSTVVARALRGQILSGDRLRPGLAIVGLASAGRAAYETAENSGLGSNGYTLLRHAFLSPHYREKYPEAYAPEIAELAYTGKYRLSDALPGGGGMTVGQALLSPTRTYAPILKAVMEKRGKDVAFIVHNTGGGQAKCLRFGSGLAYVKDNLFPPPPVFRLLREYGADPRELFRTLNMGHRMEVYCDASAAEAVIAVSRSFGVEARLVGRTEASQGGNRLLIRDGEADYDYAL